MPSTEARLFSTEDLSDRPTTASKLRRPIKPVPVATSSFSFTSDDKDDDYDDPLAALAAASSTATVSGDLTGSGMGSYMEAGDDADNDLAADDILNQVQDEDLEGLDLDEDEGTPAPHTGSSWGWGGM